MESRERHVFIVTYDLSKPGQNYERLLVLIKSEDNWARLGGSSFLLTSYSTAVELRDKFKVVLDSNDKLYVGIAESPAAWIGYSNEVSEWIKNFL